MEVLPFAPCHAFFLLPQLNLDITWRMTKEGFELCTVMGSLGGILGASIASIYVGGKSSAAIQRALQWVADLMARHGIVLYPEVVIADDDKGEWKAVKLTWPKCQVRYGLSEPVTPSPNCQGVGWVGTAARGAPSP